jgi:alkylation response protein AidB-like acyl-CoA dehydrogenase
MDLRLSDEQTMLREMLQRYLRENYDFETRRARLAEGTPFDARLWQDLADLGILGAALPETAGGLGGGAQASMLIAEALGEALAVSPYLETVVLGAGLLQASGGPWAEQLLPRIAEGSACIALAHAEPETHHVPHDISARAVRDEAGWRLSGAKVAVAWAPGATHWIVAARTAGAARDRDGISLFVVEAGTPGVRQNGYRLIDERPAADLFFDDTPLPASALLGSEGAALPVLQTVEAAGIAALAAEASGLLRRMMDDTLAYTKQRRQFGRAISEFQALQHRMVDMYIALEQVVSAAHLATLHLDTPATRDRAASAAKAVIGRAARFIGESAVQLHGAMGMTEELPVGHYFKRAAVIQGQFGTVDQHLARYAAARAA